MVPDIPDSWLQAVAGIGGIILVIILLRWVTAILEGQGKQSANLIDRSFDIADKVLAGDLRYRATAPPPALPVVTDTDILVRDDTALVNDDDASVNPMPPVDLA
jgi:hypothetical protein